VFRNYRSIAVDNNRTTVVVSVSVVVTVLPNNNRFVTISAVPIPKVFTVTIAITVTMTFHGHSIRTYTDSDFFRSSRNCAANTHHGGYCYCVRAGYCLPNVEVLTSRLSCLIRCSWLSVSANGFSWRCSQPNWRADALVILVAQRRMQTQRLRRNLDDTDVPSATQTHVFGAAFCGTCRYRFQRHGSN
jgi:hypothetical protein